MTAVISQGLSQAEAARTYRVSEATVSRLMALPADGEAASTRAREPLRELTIDTTRDYQPRTQK
ncbi:hypothetical protein [Angustibacter sp. Root456]|uniref:hypothetical protein n=1 Tax=Angustibacter sp. Root456 TaxID=1736539 RepID=UPI00138F405D|nr:hypothetical protein [Angustibacter sp. Root456]